MASVVLSHFCGLRPLPITIRRPGSTLRSPAVVKHMSRMERSPVVSPVIALSGRREWAAGVSAPLRMSPSLEEEKETQKPMLVNGIHGEDEEKAPSLEEEREIQKPMLVNGVHGRDEEKDKQVFDPGMPPPFCLAEIRAAIPKHCWVKDTWKSMSYVFRDVAVVFGLAVAAAQLNSRFVWPLYWVAQGTMFWALFVLGHDCGHGSFSHNSKLNSVVGHLLHSSILVPYHGWRISHRTHHQHHGHVENDESWHPISEKIYKSLDNITKKLRFTVPFPLFAYPVYLWARTPGRSGSHFHPSSDVFQPREKNDVITSTVCWSAMVALLAGLTWFMGPTQMINLYGIPYLVFIAWLDLVTYLHHHGHDEKLPWYRGKEWSYLRGGLTTLDRDYGWINNIHHDIGTHVIHHLFPQIPHYHLVEATKAAKPVLGKYYREPVKSGPLPLHLFGVFAKSLGRDHYVSDFGDVVYYQKDPNLSCDSEEKPQ